MKNKSYNKKNSVIIGVQIGITSGCAIYKNGEIIFAASEERYSQKKNDTAFPQEAIKDAMQYCQISQDEIENVILVSENMSPDHFLISRECSFSIQDYITEQKEYYAPRLLRGEEIDYHDVFEKKIDQRYLDLFKSIKTKKDVPKTQIWNEWRVKKVSELIGVDKSKVLIVNHEMAHAAYGYYGSPFRGEDVLVVTMDGFGDNANAFIGMLADGKIKEINKYQNFNIGRIYRYITLLLGMKPSEHEYKVMGLAPYASEYTYASALEIFENSYKFLNDGTIFSDPELKDHFYYYKDRLEACRFDGIAGGLQVFTERMISSLVKFWMNKLKKKRLVLSGGVALNIKANMEIGKLNEVEDIFVVGSGGDESLCIGGIYCYLDQINRGEEISPLKSLYLGNDLMSKEVEKAINDLHNSININVVEANPFTIAKHLAEGQIIARASGRMEFGARALGNRSILADPRSAAVVKTINRKIKNRDFWMPFTPSMIDSSSKLYLHNPKNFQFPFMSVACETTAKGQEALNGALHPADQTARPQIVKKDINSKYFDLISEFEKLTGVGALLNTSLNLHGSPIARTALDATHVLKNSDLDGLVLGEKLVLKK